MSKINTARKNCAAVVSQYYNGFALLADMLAEDGHYRAYWKISNEIVLESLCENVFDTNEPTLIFALGYIDGGVKMKLPLS